MQRLCLLLLPAASAIQHAFMKYPPSRFETPGTFEHICVQRSLPPKDNVEIIFARPPDLERSLAIKRGFLPSHAVPPREVPLDHSMRGDSILARHSATVKIVPETSVYASIGQLLQNSSVNDVRFLGGTAFMMRTPCDVLADNYYNALTEEGPLLSRVLDSWRATEDHDQSEQRTLLLTNRCRHKLYRDDLRDLLLGRHHAVQKLLPGSLVCAKRLIIEASPAKKGHAELSLRRFVEHLKASAAAEELAWRDNHGELPWDHSDTCAERQLEQEESVAPDEPQPLLVAVIQRARSRRIININALLKKLRSGFAAAARESTLSRGLDFGFYQDHVGSAVIEQVFFEDSSLTEQIKYMKRVDILVGVTGSGLTNLAFMKPARDFARSPPISPDLRGLTHTYTYTYAAHLAGLDRGRADVAPRRHRLLLLAHLARAWRARPRRGHVQAPLLRAGQQVARALHLRLVRAAARGALHLAAARLHPVGDRGGQAVRL